MKANYYRLMLPAAYLLLLANACCVIADTPPRLDAALATNGCQVSLSWSNSASNYMVYGTTSLALANWRCLTNLPSGSNGRFQVNLPTNDSQQFFRLLASPLRASGTNIVNAAGVVVRLRGLNLGGWFVMEKWMCPLDSGSLPDTYSAITNLDSRFGFATEQNLIHAYQTNWITAVDLDNITNGGYNCGRMPVWWGNFYSITNTTSAGWRPDAFNILDWLVTNCAARGIYVVIDMHGVIGGQSASDTTGRQNLNQYWTSSLDQSQTAHMWTQIAAHYKGNPTVAGYDLINEPSGAPNTAAVWNAYTNLYTAIRAVDPDHILIMEGTFGNWNWTMLPPPSAYGWTNVVYEMHEYQWGGTMAQIETGADNQVKDFHNHLLWNVPCYIGEWNDMGMGNNVYKYSIGDYDAAGMSWSLWAYKAIHGPVPDGWGWYDPTTSTFPPTPNLQTDSAATIVGDWQQWQTSDTFSINLGVGL